MPTAISSAQDLHASLRAKVDRQPGEGSLKHNTKCQRVWVNALMWWITVPLFPLFGNSHSKRYELLLKSASSISGDKNSSLISYLSSPPRVRAFHPAVLGAGTVGPKESAFNRSTAFSTCLWGLQGHFFNYVSYIVVNVFLFDAT